MRINTSVLILRFNFSQLSSACHTLAHMWMNLEFHSQRFLDDWGRLEFISVCYLMVYWQLVLVSTTILAISSSYFPITEPAENSEVQPQLNYQTHPLNTNCWNYRNDDDSRDKIFFHNISVWVYLSLHTSHNTLSISCLFKDNVHFLKIVMGFIPSHCLTWDQFTSYFKTDGINWLEE